MGIGCQEFNLSSISVASVELFSIFIQPSFITVNCFSCAFVHQNDYPGEISVVQASEVRPHSVRGLSYSLKKVRQNVEEKSCLDFG